MIGVWSLDGREYADIPIISFKWQYEILDGVGTGRTQAIGWEMFRQPEGTIYNISMTAGILNKNNTNSENFKHLINTLVNFGKYDFKPVSFVTPIGTITQDMYSPSGEVEMKRYEKDGVSYWGTFPIVFIAKRAYIT